MNYDESMEYINKAGYFGRSYGLKRIERILSHLGNPHENIKAIHIAGTNGKGSTTAMISSILVESGFKVGMYTSPYLENFEERIQINNKNIPKDRLAEVMTKVKAAIEKVENEGYEVPNQFEIITCAMFKYFDEEDIDYAVIEVGLGGRLDATNVLTPLISVITSISYDHMAILGNTLNEIAFEKCGIIKRGVPVVTYRQTNEVYNVIKDSAKAKGSKLFTVNKEGKFIDTISTTSVYQRAIFDINGVDEIIELSLLGNYQLLNCSLALKTIEVLENIEKINIPVSHKKAALKNVKWPGRLEVMNLSPLVVIDGAHNIDGITKLSESIKSYFKYERLILIIGILVDKQVENMINVICPMADRIIAVAPHNDRAESSQNLRCKIAGVNKNVSAVESYDEAFSEAMNYSTSKDMISICGSLYMIGDMRGIITRTLKNRK